MVTREGVTTELELLDRITAAPVEGAGRLNIKVQMAEPPGLTVLGAQVSPTNCGVVETIDTTVARELPA